MNLNREPGGPTPERHQDVLTLADLSSFMTQVGLVDSDFKNEQHKEAIAYRTVITQLADIFSQSQGWEMELTHYTYIIDDLGQNIGLDICLRFFNDVDEDDNEIEGGGYKEFKKFLEKNSNLIPQELRAKFELYVGFNYNDNGAVVIGKNDMSLVSQADYDEMNQSGGKIGHAADMDKEVNLEILVDNKIRQYFKMYSN